MYWNSLGDIELCCIQFASENPIIWCLLLVCINPTLLPQLPPASLRPLHIPSIEFTPGFLILQQDEFNLRCHNPFSCSPNSARTRKSTPTPLLLTQPRTIEAWEKLGILFLGAGFLEIHSKHPDFMAIFDAQEAPEDDQEDPEEHENSQEDEPPHVDDEEEEQGNTTAAKKCAKAREVVIRRAQRILGQGLNPPLDPEVTLDLITALPLEVAEKAEDSALTRVGSWIQNRRRLGTTAAQGDQTGIEDRCYVSARSQWHWMPNRTSSSGTFSAPVSLLIRSSLPQILARSVPRNSSPVLDVLRTLAPASDDETIPERTRFHDLEQENRHVLYDLTSALCADDNERELIAKFLDDFFIKYPTNIRPFQNLGAPLYPNNFSFTFISSAPTQSHAINLK
ncbi:hypothetical protein DFH07DRAFT_770490 [Mycena maculata]|uniref:Uncharacterized protein n=1 Tax=Mycena maculata TaxID=230809 RepID=A0AAD7JG20_9AGAR|nr:hypothetical protein DFH07DRAFT_770490 [Mycena maculata]